MHNFPLPMRTTHVGYVHGQRNAQGERHPGVDLNYGAPQEDKGRLIIAPTALEIIHVDRQPYYGRTVVGANHDLDLAFRFMHLDTVLVEDGQWVDPETYLGRCGDDDGSSDKRYHRGMTAHLHYDVMRLSVLKERGMNVMTWRASVTRQDVFDDVFVNPKELHGALRTLLATPTPWIPKTKNGQRVDYLR